MSIFVNIAAALLLIPAGYGFTCFYLNHQKLSDKNFTVLKLTQNKLLYLIAAAVTAAGLITLFETLYHLHWISGLKLLILAMIMFPLAAVDLRLQKIPNQLILAALAIRCLLFIPEFIISATAGFMILKDALVAALVIGGFFFLLLLVFKGSIGMGDVKLFAVMGFYQGLWGTINSVFFSLCVSFVVSVTLLLSKKKGRRDMIPFGPCILVGTVIAMGLAGM